MTASNTMKALVLRPKTGSLAVEELAVPTPGPNQIVVKVEAVGLNAVDVMNVDHPLALQESRVVGTDFAGEVARVGEDIKILQDPRVKIGARVAGFVQGGRFYLLPIISNYASDFIQQTLPTNVPVPLQSMFWRTMT